MKTDAYPPYVMPGLLGLKRIPPDHLTKVELWRLMWEQGLDFDHTKVGELLTEIEVLTK